MSYRSAVILLKDNKVALIERYRAGLHYFTFPGGHIELGETPEQAAMREAWEELGLQIVICRLVAVAEWQGQAQYYYLSEAVGGAFGTGAGEEMNHPRPERGTYLPLWIAVSEMLNLAVKPGAMAELVVRSLRDGWPEQPVTISG